MAEIALSVVARVAEYLVAPVARPFRYLWNYKSNFEKLENEVKKLEGRRDVVQHSVEDARRKGEEIEKHIDSWLDSVKNIIDEASEVVDDNHQQAHMQCFKLFSCPNLKKRHQHSKKAVGKLKDVVRLEQEAGEFKKVSYRTIPEETWLQSSKGYEAFKSRESILKNIIDALSNPDVNMVGIYGMGGVGKTTLAKEVAKQAERLKLFTEIVFVEMSDTPDIKKIQGEIADKLGLEFHEETESGRARRLCERLKKEEKILLILDNIWGSIDLEKIGIPSCDNHKGCKLLLTTRSRDVLTNKMDSQINFYIEVLNEDDTWKLFKGTAGVCSELPDMQSVALDVAKACAGVPIAIVTVAKALKDKGVSEWNKALRELRRPSPESFEGVTSEVYLSIQLSYNHLETEELKSTFLLCGRMVCIYNVSVRDLLRYGIGLGLFTRIETVEEARDNVDALISKLKASSLLLDTSNSKIFAMHDVVRDVARSIASRDHHMFTLTDDVIPWNWAYEDTLQNCTAISLHDITKLPEDLVYPQLKFFYMKTKDSFLRIPDNFFTGMPRLQVLHSIKMDLCSLPTALSQLVNLQTLCLEQCNLGDLVIGDLKKIEILSLRDSNIEKLPRETRQLTRLRLLDLSECSKLSVILPNVLSSLIQLEELYMGCSFIQWEVERPDIERSNASLDELKHLCHLTTLEIQIPDAKMYSKGLLSPKLEKYKILIGHQWYRHDWNSQYETSRMLKLNLNTEEDGIISQLKGIRELELREVPGVRNVLYDLDGKGFPELKHLCVKDNSHVSCIVDSKQSVSCGALPILELMFLSMLINLEKICNDSLGVESFLQLRTIRVWSCSKLINIFSFSIDRVLPQLQEIDVHYCKNMVEIFSIGGNDDVNSTEVIHKIHISRLRSVTLSFLPQLKSFCRKVKAASPLQLTSDTNAREIISEDELDILMPLFNEKVAFPNLEILDISGMFLEKIWHKQLPTLSSCVQNLASLIIKDCNNLKELFLSSMVNSFVQLQYLKVCHCWGLEEMVVTDKLREEERISFPQLNFLKIKDLPKLRRLYSGNYIEFSSLKEFEIRECSELKEFIFDDKVGFPNLEEIYISYMDNLEMIWHNQIAEDSFSKLKTLDVHECKKLLVVLPSNMFGRFSRLESINVISCGSVEEIFDLRGINFEERHSVESTHLRKLSITNLPNLKNIWNKNPGRILSFGHLQKLKVGGCQSLKNLFSASVAKGLSELEYLGVSDCGVEEIVAKEGEAAEEEPARFLFPKMISLKLHNLPELRTFYLGRHTIEGPVLKNLELYHCGKVRIFVSEVLSIQELDIPTQQPLFVIGKAFPCLEELNLVGKNITMMWQVQIPERPLHKLKILEIGNDGSTVLPFGIIQSFHNLETFSLFSGSYKEIFSYEEIQAQARMPTKIKKLVLRELKDLKYMWKQDSKLDFILQNLEVLQVWYCDSLIHLMSPSASFQNLTVLEVKYCRSLTNMIASSTAKSLVQLIQMSILNCKKMTEVVGNQGGVIEDRIIFSKLKSLSLQFLPNLTSFCSVNSTLEFPSLEGLTMTGCPRMKNFSQGVSSTPTLRKIEINWNSIELYSEGDINNAIQQFHEKANAKNSSKGHYSSSSHNLHSQVLQLRRTHSQVL